MSSKAKRKPYRLTLKAVLNAGTRAYVAGRLQFQDPKMRDMSCFYGAPCIIGAALPKKLRKKLDENIYTVTQAVQHKFISVTHQHLSAMEELQSLHDGLTDSGLTKNERDKMLKKFKRRLDPAYWQRYFAKQSRS